MVAFDSEIKPSRQKDPAWISKDIAYRCAGTLFLVNKAVLLSPTR